MKKRLIKVIISVISIIILGILYKYIWETYNIGIPCPLNFITGVQCPICGTTRMSISIMNFQFEKAFWYNPLIFICSPVIIIYIIYCLYCYVVEKENLVKRNMTKFSWLVIYIVLFSFMLYRNICK